MQRLAKVLFLMCLVLCTTNSRADEPAFRAVAHRNGKVLVVLLVGNNSEVSHVTTFDILSPDYRLRRLHDMDLLTTCVPLLYHVSPSGRFFVTVNDGIENSKNSKHALVVYDLFRRESTNYKLLDIFSEEQLQSLEEKENDPCFGVRWFAPFTHLYLFDEDRREFYPTPRHLFAEDGLPSNYDDVPFVVVDLLTRKARVEPSPVNAEKVFEPMTFDMPRWETSNTRVKNPDGSYACSTLPDFLQCKTLPTDPKVSKDDAPVITYRLDPILKEYAPTNEEDWKHSPERFGCTTPR